MPHLKETEFVDLLDGALRPSRAGHVDGCPQCTAQLDALRATLVCVETDAASEPSPLFWNAFPSRVSAAIDQQPASWLSRPVFAALACAAALLIVIGSVAVWPSLAGRPDVSRDVLPSAVADASVIPDDDVEQDAAWAVVRTAADGLDYEDALEAGISTGPGAAERAAMEMSTEEQAELVRLIEREMKRSGAWDTRCCTQFCLSCS